eukprot:scaffold8596_cov118-Skeletonema_marinoi.AAC.1
MYNWTAATRGGQTPPVLNPTWMFDQLALLRPWQPMINRKLREGLSLELCANSVCTCSMPSHHGVPVEAISEDNFPPHPTSSLLPGLAAHSLCAEAHPYVPPDEVIAEQPTDHPSFGPPPKRVPSGDSPSTSSLPSGLAATSLCAEAHPYVPPDEVIAEQPTDHPSYGPLPPTTTQPKPP